MIQNSGGSRLVLKARQHLVAARAVNIEPHRFQRQSASDVRIGRPIYDSHCALA